MDVIIKKSSTGKDIDLISKDLKKTYKKFLEKGFVKVPYYYGFFMKKLFTKGLITFHIQDEVFFINKNELILIKGFSNLVQYNNYDYVIYMMKMYFEGKQKSSYIQEIEKHYNKPYKDIDIEKEIKNFIKDKSLKIIKKNILLKKFFLKLNRLKYFFYPRFIAITGVDGSGKSSIVKELKKVMGHNCDIVYMGKKDWSLKISKFAFEKKRFPSVVNILILYIEYWYRFLRTFRSSKVIIFDRYPMEMYLSQKGLRKFIYYILFNILFPKPNYIFYLYCPMEVSLKRKDDIENINEFKERKEKFDKFYMKKSDLVIDTFFHNKRRTLRQIIKNIDKKTVEIL